MTLCWICGAAEADSREHRSKKSDLKRHLGRLSPATPAFFNSATAKNAPIRGLNANRLKTGQIVCGECNSTLTQPHDDAWSLFSDWLARTTIEEQPPAKVAHCPTPEVGRLVASIVIDGGAVVLGSADVTGR